MKKALFALALLVIAVQAQAGPDKIKDVDSTLYAHYVWCTANIRDAAVLLKADTLFRLSREKNDIRMQAASLSIKADHYYFNNNVDSLRAWIPRVQQFARDNDQLKYYYFTWGRLTSYYIKQGQYTLAQYELERLLAEAGKDDYKPATADAYRQMGHIYRTQGIQKLAISYYQKAIDYIEQNDLDKQPLPTLYAELVSLLMQQDRLEEAAEALGKGKASVIHSTSIWTLKIKEISLLIKMDRIDEAKALLQEVRQNSTDGLTNIKLLEVEISLYTQTGETDKALAKAHQLLKYYEEGTNSPSYYFHLFNILANLEATSGDYKAAYENQQRDISLYDEKINENNEKSLGEFATLLDVNRLDRERAESQREAQEERLQRTQLGFTALSLILTLAIAFIIFIIRMNRRLARAKRAAEESNRMKSVFIRNITHEINTPLNAIVGFSELAATSTGEDSERQSYIGIIQENSGYLQKLVDDVLYIAGLESSETPPSLAPIDINACCQRSIDIATNYTLQTNIRFVPEREKLLAHTSGLFLTKALTELLCNAVRFAPDSQVILAYTVSSDGRKVIFTVTDHGPGIPAAEAEHIFERFVKLDAFSQGMGLGLSVCQLISVALGGKIELDTSYTEGARFTFSIPTY